MSTMRIKTAADLTARDHELLAYYLGQNCPSAVAELALWGLAEDAGRAFSRVPGGAARLLMLRTAVR